MNEDNEVRLACGCIGECDPYAHDTAPFWYGTHDGPGPDDVLDPNQLELPL